MPAGFATREAFREGTHDRLAFYTRRRFVQVRAQDSPLCFHKATGYYIKTVKAVGTTSLRTKNEALRIWQLHKESFRLGIDPRKEDPTPDGSKTLRDCVNEFLTAKECQVTSGEIKQRTFDDLHATCGRMVEFWGGHRAVVTLRPAHFTAYKAKTAETRNVVSLTNEITRVRQVFIWCAKSKLIASEPDFGPEFVRSSPQAIRRHRNRREDPRSPERKFSERWSNWACIFRAMAWLGINCGFTPSDCAELPLNGVDLEKRMDFLPRPKTEVNRLCPLWPETLQALRESQAWRVPSKTSDAAGRFFTTYRGSALSEMDQPVTRRFTEALKRIEAHRSGKSFYSLRHSFATKAREANDDTAVRVIMGHKDQSILDEHYTHGFDRSRLLRVANHVRHWLLEEGGKQ